MTSLFSKYFLSPRLFTVPYYTCQHSLKSSKASKALSFEWKLYSSKDNVWPPFYRAVVIDKESKVKEVSEFHKNGVLIDVKTYKL